MRLHRQRLPLRCPYRHTRTAPLRQACERTFRPSPWLPVPSIAHASLPGTGRFVRPENLLVAREQAAKTAGDFPDAMAHPRVDAAGDRLVRAPDPEAARFGHQPMAHRAAIGFREVVEDDAAPGASALGDGAATVQQLRVPDEYVALAGLEQFALQPVLLHLLAHPALPRAQFFRNEMALAVGENVRFNLVAAGPVAQQPGFRRTIFQRHPHR